MSSSRSAVDVGFPRRRAGLEIHHWLEVAKQIERRRSWFVCPRCGRHRRHLHLKEFACRTCCGLDYACRHVARWAPSVRRIIRWRKQIGVDPTPFAAIPRIRAVAIAFIERSG
jgi:hypothetical protein